MDMGMGSNTVGVGVSSLYLQQMYWAVVGAVIAVATAVNVYSHFLYRQRVSSASKYQTAPAKPRSVVTRTVATLTAITREATYVSLPPLSIRGYTVPTPTLGRTSVVLANTIVLVVFCFYKLKPSNRWSYEDVAYRAGFITTCQLPLLFLLAGKNNIVGWLTGTSYERLNWLHRWTSRTLLLTATIHMGYFFADWAPYNYIGIKITTDSITKRGVIAWAILVWICISSTTPIRGWNYELFVLQHLISFVAFIAAVYLHTPGGVDGVHTYIWIPIGLFIFDRLVRALYNIYINLAIFHPKAKSCRKSEGLWSCKAEFTPLPHDTTRITIRDPPISWNAGQHVFLSCHSLVPLQSHPFTIASIPEDGRIEFLVKSERGGTKRFYKHAARVGLPTTTEDVELRGKRSVAIEGPYGRIRPLRQFDSVVFFAGSTGATFTVPLLRSIVASWKDSAANSSATGGMFRAPVGAVTRHLRFVWVVKSRGQLSWFAKQLGDVVEDVKALREIGHDIEVDMSVYVTCDETFTSEHKSLLSSLQSSQPQSQQQQHGKVEEIDPSYSPALDEKEKTMLEDAKTEIRETDSSIISSTDRSIRKGEGSKRGGACGPDGTCCCTANIEDEDASASDPVVCNCNCSPSPVQPASSSNPSLKSSASNTSRTTDEKAASLLLLHPAIALFSGRPVPRNIIRKTLEHACGESAVVVCGPQGLVNDVRHSVVSLSDERAVHKGTGAQGVYLHAEAFAY
ncbi:hypothetical protein B0A49_04046 [Cryomyces minteri]|uniref:ferric-chelate reductase (NADPH) n=1 Tax=Cryomyces minteri TaxID=331657 RepID=A0A4U0XIM7_9PEZI|nr:hypothetical protein B0A49_04046 [Cryomyces minteri]